MNGARWHRRGRRLAAACLVLASLTPERPVPAQEERRGALALEEASGVEILRADEPLYRAPDARAARRGTARKGALLPLFSHARGPGCEGLWLEVGPLAWVCESVVALSGRAALAAEQRQVLAKNGMPYQYFFVSDDGALGYRNLETAEQGYPDAELEPGFALGVVQVRERFAGDPFGLTTHGLWVPLRDLRAITPPQPRAISSFAGEHVWVTEPKAQARAKPSKTAPRTREYERLTLLPVLEQQGEGDSAWFKTAADAWLTASQVTWRRGAEAPAGLVPQERWIDVDVEQQVLTLYRGRQPVFAAPVSSGRGEEGSEEATPRGEFRIWVKLLVSDMDNLEDPDAGHYYAMQSVPWVMYFKQGYGLHGAFWHNDFGQVRSHGCVNLVPSDAESLFALTGPRLPAGWTAVFPTEYDPGTLVRVR